MKNNLVIMHLLRFLQKVPRTVLQIRTFIFAIKSILNHLCDFAILF